MRLFDIDHEPTKDDPGADWLKHVQRRDEEERKQQAADSARRRRRRPR